MLTKLYEKIIEYIKKEYKFLITLMIILVISTYKLPYYIDAPGGIINISDRINIENSKKLEGTMNFAYVSELRATIPTLIIEKLNKDWDLVDFNEIVATNETPEEAEYRDKILLKEALSNAQYIGFKKSNTNFEIKNQKIYVTGIYKDAKTDLHVGDQIVKVDDIKINNYEDLEYVRNKKEGEKVNITVINNNKEYNRTATLIKIEDKTLIGVSISQTFDIESEKQIKIVDKARESGPSGGLMMSLTIYSYLSNEDLTKGRTIVGTGTIDKEGIVGSIGGVKYKLIGAVKNKADLFIVPNGENYEEAIKVKEEKGYDIKIYGVDTFDEALEILKK
jgi:PDZ domain-containing protein